MWLELYTQVIPFENPKRRTETKQTSGQRTMYQTDKWVFVGQIKHRTNGGVILSERSVVLSAADSNRIIASGNYTLKTRRIYAPIWLQM